MKNTQLSVNRKGIIMRPLSLAGISYIMFFLSIFLFLLLLLIFEPTVKV